MQYRELLTKELYNMTDRELNREILYRFSLLTDFQKADIISRLSELLAEPKEAASAPASEVL